MNSLRQNTLIDRFFNSLNRQKNKKLLWLEIYTIVFLITFYLVFSTFILGNRTIIWCIDGRYQMMPWLHYAGKYFLRVIDCIIQRKFPIPLFDISMGWGDDIIGYLGSSGHMEPIAMLLSSFAPLTQIETLYFILTLLRLYASGLAFLYMCQYFKKDPAFAMAGALIYLFNGYTLFMGSAYPYFLNAMVLLPLMIIGADRIIRHRKSILFIFCVFYAGLCGFYLLYMLSALVAIFALVRFFDIYEKGRRLRIFLNLLFQSIMQYCIGFGMAAPILFPSFAELFASARSRYNNFFLSNVFLAHWRTFWERLMALITPKTYYESDWGVDFHAYAAVFFLAFVLMILKKRRKTLKLLSLISFFIFFSPIGGWVMNGFQYSSNRWSFGFALLASYIVVEMLPDLFQLDKRQDFILILLICLYTMVGIFYKYMRVSLFILVGATFLAISLLAIQYAGKSTLRVQRIVCVTLVSINVGVNALYTLSPDGMNWISWFEESGNELLRVAYSMEADGEKFPFYDEYMDGRFDSSSFGYNNSMYFGIPGTLFYSSTYNGDVVHFLEEMEESGCQQNFKIHSTDQRTMMDTLLSVKYSLEREECSDYVPYDYTYLGSIYTGRNAYKNENALPWGYTYNESISYDEIENLNGIQKQQALLQAVAIDDSSSESTISFEEEEIPYTLEFKDCEWNNGMLKAKSNGVITLKADLYPGKEYYIRLKNFDVDNYTVSHRITNTWAASFNFTVKCGNITKYSRAESKQYTCYYGRKNYLFNMGCSDKKRDIITINFNQAGEFGLEDIELYALPMTNYDEWVDCLREEPLKNIQIETNQISGTVDLSKDKILCLTIPYSKGWTAYVDGEKVEIIKANYAFMGLKLHEGHHDIVFEYFTPGLKLGVFTSMCCLCFLLILFIIDRKKRHNYGKV